MIIMINRTRHMRIFQYSITSRSGDTPIPNTHLSSAHKSPIGQCNRDKINDQSAVSHATKHQLYRRCVGHGGALCGGLTIVSEEATTV